MSARRFSAHAAPGPRGRAVIAVPFDPDEAWGAKAEHPVGGTIDGKQVRGTVARDGSGWAFTLTPMWMRDAGVTAGTDVIVELAPEGPQRGDLAGDIAAALEASPPAAAWARLAGSYGPGATGTPNHARNRDAACSIAARLAPTVPIIVKNPCAMPG